MRTAPKPVQACQSGGPKVTLKDNSASIQLPVAWTPLPFASLTLRDKSPSHGSQTPTFWRLSRVTVASVKCPDQCLANPLSAVFRATTSQLGSPLHQLSSLMPT